MPEKLEQLVKKFHFEKILNSDSQLKVIAILGTVNESPAILTLEKSHFNYTEEQLKSNNLNIFEILEIANNDVYFWGMNLLGQDLFNSPSSKINLIYPATETHIRKFNKPILHVVHETPEVYTQIVKPYIDTMRGDRIKWVKNILFEGAEADRIVYKNDQFILIPDMKWDGVTMESLYLCCIVYREDIASVRDLNVDHVDYLEKLLKDLREEVPTYYNGKINGDQLRIFVHYQPSYYHFHIHVVNVGYSGLGESILTGKAILLEEVIDNLKFLGKEGYRKKTLCYVMNESHKLWELGLKDCV